MDGGCPQEKLNPEPKRGKDSRAMAYVTVPSPGGETGMSVLIDLCCHCLSKNKQICNLVFMCVAGFMNF